MSFSTCWLAKTKFNETDLNSDTKFDIPDSIQCVNVLTVNHGCLRWRLFGLDSLKKGQKDLVLFNIIFNITFELY